MQDLASPQSRHNETSGTLIVAELRESQRDVAEGSVIRDTTLFCVASRSRRLEGT